MPTAFSGVAELGLIAGAGMIMAFICTLGFLPAAITLFRPRGESAEVGFACAARLDPVIVRRRRAILVVFGSAGGRRGRGLAAGCSSIPTRWTPRTRNTEAMRTLRDLINNPLTNPYTIDVLAPNAEAARRSADKLEALPTVAGRDQHQQLRARPISSRSWR